jgi:hypothetical protein
MSPFFFHACLLSCGRKEWLMRSPCYSCVSTFELVDYFSWNLAWTLCRWKPPKINTFFSFHLIATWQVYELVRLDSCEIMYCNMWLNKCAASVECETTRLWHCRIFISFHFCRGTWWHSWLRHCATSRQPAVLIPDGVIGIFHWPNPFGRTVALGSTQPLTEMSTSNICWGVKAAGA